MHLSRRSLGRTLGGTLIALGVAATVRAQDRAAVGHVIRQTGPVTVLRDGTPSPLLLGGRIFRTDMIVTGDDAQLLIEFVDGSTVAVSADCQIRIDDYAIAPDGGRWSAVLSLIVGVVRATVQPAAPDSFTVRTTTAVASARSTDWVVETGAGTTAVFVVEGTVVVSGSVGQPVLLEPGFGTDIDAGAPPTEPKRWGEARVERTLARVRLP